MKTLAALLLAPAAISTAAFAQDAPVLTVALKPGPASQATGKSHVDVTLTIPSADTPAGAPLLAMPIVIANSVSVAEGLTAMTARDANGPLTLRAKDDAPALAYNRHWTADRAVRGDLVVSYRAPVDNTPPARGSAPPYVLRIDGEGVSGVGSMFLMTPENDKPYRIQIAWDLSAMAKGSTAVSSYGEGNVEMAAGPAARLSRTVFMAGPMQREPRQVSATGFSSAWMGEPTVDARPLMEWTHKLHTAMRKTFKDEGDPPYRVFLRYNPINGGGGTAMPFSFIVTYKEGAKDEDLKSVLAHEMIHTWTSNGPGAWYSEGNAVHYQALIPWRAGLMTTDDFLKDINDTARRYYTNALNDTPDEQIAPRFWEDTRIRTLPYDRGGLYFAVLDDKIRKATGGKRSVDDLIQEMIENFRAGRPVTEAAWTGLIQHDLGEEGLKIHASMKAGGLMLPDSDAFGPCFRRTTAKFRRFDFGYDPLSLVGDVKTIRGLVPGSEADKAGLRNGDVVTYAVALDGVQGDQAATLTLQVTRDGKTFPITYLPRGEAVDAYQWTRVAGVPDSACRY